MYPRPPGTVGGTVSVIMASKLRTHYPKVSDPLRSEEPNVQTEAALMEGFTKSLVRGGRSIRRPPRIVLEELAGLQGRPDLVVADIVALPGSVDLDSFASCLRSPTKAALLASLKYGVPRSITYLGKVTGLSTYSIKRHINVLDDAAIVSVDANSAVTLRCRLPWDMVKIAAYEGKLSNWRRALHQASGYRAFAQSVWVVMPPTGARRAKAVEPIFRNNGIGLISVSDNGDMRVEIRGKTRRTPASRRLYLMAVGGVLTEYLSERRRLHSRLRPETIKTL